MYIYIYVYIYIYLYTYILLYIHVHLLERSNIGGDLIIVNDIGPIYNCENLHSAVRMVCVCT